MSSYSEETVSAPPAKKRKTSNSDSATNSVSQENHSAGKVGGIRITIRRHLSGLITLFNNILVFASEQATMADNGSVDNQMQIDEGLYSRQL